MQRLSVLTLPELQRAVFTGTGVYVGNNQPHKFDHKKSAALPASDCSQELGALLRKLQSNCSG
jgi:hypothetical protein